MTKTKTNTKSTKTMTETTQDITRQYKTRSSHVVELQVVASSGISHGTEPLVKCRHHLDVFRRNIEVDVFEQKRHTGGVRQHLSV